MYSFSCFFKLEDSVENLNDKAECANHDLKADIERWHKNKRQDFKELFTNYSDCLIDYYKKVNNVVFTVITQIINSFL